MIRYIIIFYFALLVTSLAQYIGARDGIFNPGGLATGGSPIQSCAGVLDLSVGCPLPMLGVF